MTTHPELLVPLHSNIQGSMSMDMERELVGRPLDEFLARRETGVLSLARANEPYAIPISYGYDADARRFYLRLVSTPESEKRSYLGSSPDARLVIYEGDADTYWSAIATGTLEEIPRDALDIEAIEQFGETKRPLFEIWGGSKEDLDILLYKLDADTLSGRRIDVER